MPIERYGRRWPDGISDFEIELICFRENRPDITGLSKSDHFKNITHIGWGPKSKKQFKWNPWSDSMLEEACKQMWLGLSGCASSTKSTFCALWGLINWLADPKNTSVLITSTGIKEAKQRIWGELQQFFLSVNGLPGKLLSSPPMIRNFDGVNKFDEKAGIHLIAGDRSKERENVQKLIGIKSPRVILIADELPELSPSLAEAAMSNLVSNPSFQMVGIGNFKSIYDPFGQFVEPKHGWQSIDLDSEQWTMKNGGLCLRFDGLKSPNIVSGHDKWPFLYNSQTLARHKSALGENTASFYRMCRSFMCPEHETNCIYSEADFLKGRVHESATWMDIPTNVAFLDPAFATGGDRAMVVFGKIGQCTDGKIRLCYTKSHEIREDLRLKEESRSLQVARQFKSLCEQEGVSPRNAGYDFSGGGMPFGALLSELWSNLLLGVQFGGNASDLPVNSKEYIASHEAYANRVTELWFQGREFMQSDQIRGMTPGTARELKARKYDTLKSGAYLKTKVESKSDMKLRTGGVSPDEADAALGLLDLCRQRHSFIAGGLAGKRHNPNKSWLKKALQSDEIYEDSYSTPEIEVFA